MMMMELFRNSTRSIYEQFPEISSRSSSESSGILEMILGTKAIKVCLPRTCKSSNRALHNVNFIVQQGIKKQFCSSLQLVLHY